MGMRHDCGLLALPNDVDTGSCSQLNAQVILHFHQDYIITLAG